MDRDRLRHVLAGRAPLPARGLRVHPEHPDAGGPPGPPDEEHRDRLRLQHRADVAPAAAGRGLRHRRHPDRRPGRLRRRARLPHPRGRDVRRADARPGRQPRAVRGAGRHHLQGVQRARLLAPGQALHAAAAGALPRLRAGGDHAGAAAATLPGRVLAADRQRQPARRSTSWPSTASRASSAAARRPAGPTRRSSRPGARRCARARPRDRAGRATSASASRSTSPTREEQAIKEATPFFEENIKMFAPLGFVRGPHRRADRGGRRPEAGASGQPADAARRGQGRRLADRPARADHREAHGDPGTSTPASRSSTSASWSARRRG